MEALKLNFFPPLPAAEWQAPAEIIRSLPERLREAQDTFQHTGGLHAAGLFTPEGRAIVVREDVGRHNAVDKVIGTQFLEGKGGLGRTILVVSGRASFELMQKALAAGSRCWSRWGRRRAWRCRWRRKFGATLLGFTKPSGFNIYTGSGRVRIEGAAATPSYDNKPDPHSHHPPDPARQGDPRHEPHLDTVAQKPTHIGTGSARPGRARRRKRTTETRRRGPTAGGDRAPDPAQAARGGRGMPALIQSLKYTMRETGFARGIRTWLKVNKKDGFDCQSCAWPNPDRERHLFEFCENGVKALASEATLKHAGPDFFREHSIEDLQKQSDYWLELQGGSCTRW